MPLDAPNLDDRRFADLVDEAVRLIPRFAPEWTDRSDSDPGIAITKLFAWMTELTLYRINQVPERAYIKFLQMVGIERRPAAAARTQLQFTPARSDISGVWVPEGTAVAAADDGNGPVQFETVAALNVLGTPLIALQSWDGFSHVQVTTAAGAAGQNFYPFGPRARPGAALMLGFAGPAALTDGPIDLSIGLQESVDAPAPERRTDPASAGALPPPARLVWEYWDLAVWQPLTVLSDGTAGFSHSGHIVLRGPGSAARLAQRGDVATPLYWLRCRIETAAWERSPRLDFVQINCVEAVQALRVRDQVVGRSDGSPGQQFLLANPPVLTIDPPRILVGPGGVAIPVTALHLEVDEGSGFVPWRQVEDFLSSGPDDMHFTLNRASGLVQFGDGRRGRIPAVFAPAGVRGNIMARFYLTGGGRRGNLPAGTINALQGFIPGIASASNIVPATGGAEEESVANAKARAAATISANGRAVTASDFEVKAIEAGVRRAKALPLAHPRYPGVDMPGCVSVIVVPDGDAPNPMPSPRTLAVVADALDRSRLITTEIHVVPPVYNEVTVAADIIFRRTANPAQVLEAIEKRLNGFLHPLTGGSDGLGWPFGGTIHFSDLYRLVIETPDVLRINDGQLTISVNGERAAFCRDVELCAGELVFAGKHSLALFAEGRVP
jgi:predicted phage baseplate assembly protein